MSIENFIASLSKECSDLRAKREKSSGGAKGAITRRIKTLELAMKKATRKGLQE